MIYSYQESSEIMSFLHENCVGELRKDVLNEDVQAAVTAAAIDRMLDLTLSKYSKIDFSDIERSRGDVENCKFYKNLRDSVNILCDINATTNKIPGAIIVSDALNNLEILKSNFIYGYRTKNALSILLYNTMYYTIMEATSYLIAASIDYVRSGDKIEANCYEINGRDVLLLNNLVKFNEQVASGKVAKFIVASHDTEVEAKESGSMNEGAIGDAYNVIKDVLSKIKDAGLKDVVVNNNGSVTTVKRLNKLGTGIVIGVGAAALIYLAINIIPIIQSCMYVIFKARHKISEAARLQAELIELNIELLKESGANEEIIKKQEAAAKRFRAIADKFALDCDKTERDAKKEVQQDQVDANSVII